MAVTISELEYFVKTAELESVSRAAEQLHIVQPSLSRSIQSLEKDLGVSLFDRVGRNVVLNSYGKIAQRYAIKILSELNAMQEELDSAKDTTSQTIQIALGAASTFMPALLMRYKLQHPDVRFEIMQAESAPQEGGHWDLHLFSSNTPVDNDNTVTLMAENLVMAIPESDPRAAKKSVRLSEFADDEFICLQKGKGLRTIIDYYCSMAGFSPNIILESDSPSIVREYIKAGIGVSLVPEITWCEVRGDNIALLQVNVPRCSRYICLSWNSSGYLTAQTLRFRDYLCKEFVSAQ